MQIPDDEEPAAPPDPLRRAVFRFSELRRDGLTRRQIAQAVHTGRLRRLRRGVYAVENADQDVVQAAELGGRLACVSMLHKLGVFVLDHSELHCHLPANASRLPERGPRVIGHWQDLRSEPLGSHAVSLRDAIQQSIRCQPARAAVATMDSLLHRGLVDLPTLREICSELPARLQVLMRLVDPRAESGPETLLRLALRTLGCSVEIQVWIHAVGRVDFVLDGWLIVECDSREFHGGWDRQAADRARDLEAAAQGYYTVRVIAEDVFARVEEISAQLARLLEHGPRGA